MGSRRIAGRAKFSQIRAKAWEMLLAMLVLESAFGIPGLIAAPVYYAYMKAELRDKGMI